MANYKITVRYTGYNPELDRLICEALETHCFEREDWYYSFSTNRRDIIFVYKGSGNDVIQTDQESP